jgi:hypothetical protein
MERRRDVLFRQVVEQVEPSLTESGFRLLDRGWLGEYRWVEFSRLRWGPAERAREEHLVVYHLAEHRHVGVRLQSRNPAERTDARQVMMNQWSYEPSATEDGAPEAVLGAQVRGWVADALAKAS